MSASLVALIGLASFFLAYHLYGSFLARKIFGIDPDRETPAVLINDGIDFVPTNKQVLFGHHFTSIAGAAPIIGPAIAVIWGWVPAFLWVILGTIFIGAAHDFGCLITSTKNGAKSIPDLTRPIISPTSRILFLLIVLMLCWIVLAVFGFVIATLFVNFPQTVLPINIEIIVALVVGYLFYVKKVDIFIPSVVALAILWGSVFIGIKAPLNLPSLLGGGKITENSGTLSLTLPLTFNELKNHSGFDPKKLQNLMDKGGFTGEDLFNSTGPITASRLKLLQETTPTPIKIGRNKIIESWIFLLLLYSFIAAALPVWVLLQPRDYINSHQLFVGLGAMYLGLFISNPPIQAPPFNLYPDAPMPWFPFLFITIACGAISGFHGLVGGGTTSKQIKSEGDAQYIGYGAMLGEGSLALMALLACSAGFANSTQWHLHYASWGAANTLGAKMGAFVNGGAYFLKNGLLIPEIYGVPIVVIIVISFAATTLDSCCRIMRYILEELGDSFHLTPLKNRWVASGLAAFTPMILVFGGENLSWVRLWPIFGATNQLLAGLSLMVITIYLLKKGKPYFYTLLPMMFVMLVTIFSMFISLKGFLEKGNSLLVVITTLLLLFSLWIIIEGLLIFGKVRRSQSQGEKDPTLKMEGDLH